MNRFHTIRRWPCLLAAAAIFNGCATLFHGSTDMITLSSQPIGARVTVNGQDMGATPLRLKLLAKHTYSIGFHKDGYKPKIVLVNNSVGAGWIILDVLGGLLPMIVDASTGDWYSLDQENVNAALEAQQTE